MSKKDNGVLYIKYKDDKEAKNGRGIAVHLYQDVKYYRAYPPGTGCGY